MSSSNSSLNQILRKSFSNEDFDNLIPNLIFLQKDSFRSFIDIENKNTKDTGLLKLLKSFFPISDSGGRMTLEFLSYRVGNFKYTISECKKLNKTRSAPIFANLRLIEWADSTSSKKEIKMIKEQEVFLIDMPIMTEVGSFIINGIERAIVSQLKRAPGVFFSKEESKNHPNTYVYKEKIIPTLGSWIEYEFDTNEILNFRIDSREKIKITGLLKILGYSNSEIIKEFYKNEEIQLFKDNWAIDFDYSFMLGRRAEYDIIDVDTKEVKIAKNTKITKGLIKKLKDSGFKKFIINESHISSYIISEDLIDSSTGNIILSAGSFLSKDNLDTFQQIGVKSLQIVNPYQSDMGHYIFTTLNSDNRDLSSVLKSVTQSILGQQTNNLKDDSEMLELFENTFFTSKYSFSETGRMKFNSKIGSNTSKDILHLTKEDILLSIKAICKMKSEDSFTDDIDNLSNRRVRLPGELIENQFAIGMSKVEKIIIEKINNSDIDSLVPQNLINTKPLASSLGEFFATSQLSQYMDQTNPLSSIAHKRRITSLGEGGIVRDRAQFEVRDVHHTHYGRLCPIETPEGQNIGLINSLAIYATFDKYGFIQTPYRKVVNGVITDEVVYVSALNEEGIVIAPSNIKVDNSNKIIEQLVPCRKNDENLMLSPSEVNYVDINPRQIISLSASLIPFIENDDAKRALTGSNMMRQAVPLLKTEAPFVGTGLEKNIIQYSDAVIIAENSGVVKYVDGNKIIIESNEKNSNNSLNSIDTYHLKKYKKSNNDTSINQTPSVFVGQSISKGDVITTGQSVDRNELAIGKNILIGFMSWSGYNYEDSIIASENLVKNDALTSIHIVEYEISAIDTKFGPEEITSDIPSVKEEILSKLDESGIVHIGSEVMPGDILVGKVSPKTDSVLTPEEKLLKNIFGEKVLNVKDSSLYMPSESPGGTVINVEILTRNSDIEKSDRARFIDQEKITNLLNDKNQKISIIQENFRNKVAKIVSGKKISENISGIEAGELLNSHNILNIAFSSLFKMSFEDELISQSMETIKNEYQNCVKEIEDEFQKSASEIQSVDELPQGVLETVKIYVAIKQKLHVGDKMTGRHGNKGVISKILSVEDMPFLEDGTPIDMILNPLGVPPRMNIGQIMETHLGMASSMLGHRIADILDDEEKSIEDKEEQIRNKLNKIYTSQKEIDAIEKLNSENLFRFANSLRKGIPFATGSFNNIATKTIEDIMVESGMNASGQMQLRDGRSGEFFDRPITVGYMYMLKLNHLVDNKIHARSTGPYSLTTQQPLGGKSHGGGQRFGEMECWALQAYGAAYTLQEMLTIKSDDIAGRNNIFDSIISNKQTFSCGMPESFKVMVKEVRALGLNIELIKQKSK